MQVSEALAGRDRARELSGEAVVLEMENGERGRERAAAKQPDIELSDKIGAVEEQLPDGTVIGAASHAFPPILARIRGRVPTRKQAYWFVTTAF